MSAAKKRNGVNGVKHLYEDKDGSINPQHQLELHQKKLDDADEALAESLMYMENLLMRLNAIVAVICDDEECLVLHKYTSGGDHAKDGQ